MVKFIISKKSENVKENSLYSHSRLKQYFGRCSLFITSISMLHGVGIEATTSFTYISLEPCGKYDLIGSCALGHIHILFNS